MELDDLDWRLLELLQGDARMSFSELGRRVSLSAPAVTDRIHKLEAGGVITGYHAIVDPAKLGLPIEAVIRVRLRSLDGPHFRENILPLPQVHAADHVTGDECWVLRARCVSTTDLENLVEQIHSYGETTTSLIFSSPLRHRAITRAQRPI